MAAAESPQPRKSWLNRTVLALSATSLFSDISHEMGTAVMPILLTALTAGPAALGIIEGVAELLFSLGKLYGGTVGDRLRQRKWLTGSGYLLTTLGIGSYAIAGSWWHVLVGRSVAWFGRGFRGPLRDALMADGTDRKDYGKAFGLERAADAVGAVIGPLVSALLLWLLLPLKLILALVMLPGAIATAAVWGLVREEPREARPSPKRLLGRLGELPAGYRRFLLAIALFALGDYSNTLLIMWAAGKYRGPGLIHEQAFIPILLYAGYNIVSAIVAYVSGHLSDRMGRRGLLLVGYACGVVSAALIATGTLSWGVLIAVFAISGITMGNQEAVEKAYAADFLRPEERALGFGMLALVNGIGKLVASSVVGVLWASVGVGAAFGYAAAVSLLGVIALATVTARSPRPAAEFTP